MARISRREFGEWLGRLGLATAAMNLGCEKASEPEPVAEGNLPWGQIPERYRAAGLPAGRTPEVVLEHFLAGGVNQWDTFYVVPEFGKRGEAGKPGTHLWTFTDVAEDNANAAFHGCGGGDVPFYEPFATDSVGRTIHLGPWLFPLRARPDILKRMRLVVVTHPLEPHSVAVPLMLTGRAQATGSELVSLAAHVQRWGAEQTGDSRVVPWSWVLLSDEKRPNMGTPAVSASVGRHPGWAQPLTVRLAPDSDLQVLLGRSTVKSKRDAIDRLADANLKRFRDALSTYRLDPATEARALRELEHARRVMKLHEQLRAGIPPNLVQLEGGDICGVHADYDSTRVCLQTAARLITAPGERPRFVNVVDSGFESVPFFGGYDSHLKHVHYGSVNLVNASRQLSEIINRPGENDPGKLDLDKHTIALTTEFGRRHTVSITGDGLDHWPYGFVVALIGGAITEEQAGVAGALTEDGAAVDGISPLEFRAAMMLMMGIWPFSPEAFRASDIRGATDELTAAMWLREHVLGYPG